MRFLVEVIPHICQRYNTVGDWQFREDGTLVVKVSELGNWRMEIAIAIHEIVETYLCKEAGITEEMVDEFDFAYAAARKPGDTSEPGDDPRAPYHQQHKVATRIEKFVCLMLGVKWKFYETKQQEAMLHYDL